MLLFLGGMAYPLHKLPGALQAVAKGLPAAALSESVRGVLSAPASVPAWSLVVLAAWAVAAPLRRDPLLPLGRVAAPGVAVVCAVSRAESVRGPAGSCRATLELAAGRELAEDAVGDRAVGVDEDTSWARTRTPYALRGRAVGSSASGHVACCCSAKCRASLSMSR